MPTEICALRRKPAALHAGVSDAVGTLAGSLGIGAVVFVGVSFLELKRYELSQNRFCSEGRSQKPPAPVDF